MDSVCGVSYVAGNAGRKKKSSFSSISWHQHLSFLSFFLSKQCVNNHPQTELILTELALLCLNKASFIFWHPCKRQDIMAPCDSFHLVENIQIAQKVVWEQKGVTYGQINLTGRERLLKIINIQLPSQSLSPACQGKGKTRQDPGSSLLAYNQFCYQLEKPIKLEN